MTAAPAPVETCKYGHPWTVENTYWQGGRYRQCRVCRAERARRFRARRKAQRQQR